MTEFEALARIGELTSDITNAQDLLDQNWEDDIRHHEEILQAQLEGRNLLATGGFLLGTAHGIGDAIGSYRVPSELSYFRSGVDAANESEDDRVENAVITSGIEALTNEVIDFVFGKAAPVVKVFLSGVEGASSIRGIPVRTINETFDAYDDLKASVEAGFPVPYELGVHPAQAHVSMEHLYSQTWVDSGDNYIGHVQPMGTRHYADIRRAKESLGFLDDATIRALREQFPELPYEAAESFSEWIYRNKNTIVDAGIKSWEEVLINHARGGELPSLAAIRSDARNHAYLTSGFNQHFPEDELGEKVEHATDKVRDFQNAAGDAEYELGMLQAGFGYAGEGAGEFTAATDGLTLSTETAEQALLAAGLSGTAVTQVFDIMHQTGLDPTTIAWDELEAAVHAWGDATGTEVDRVIGRLGELARAHAGAGPGSSGSEGSGGGSAGVDLDQLLSLARRVAVSRAEMDDLPPEYVAHELGKLPGQLDRPGSDAEKLALLQLFFAGAAHGIAFGLGPSAQQLGFTIPQFASGGIVSSSYGVSPPVAAHGGEHIIPHRATGNPIIVEMKVDRGVLSKAVLGELLRLQGREVTLGFS